MLSKLGQKTRLIATIARKENSLGANKAKIIDVNIAQMKDDIDYFDLTDFSDDGDSTFQVDQANLLKDSIVAPMVEQRSTLFKNDQDFIDELDAIKKEFN